MRKRGRPLKSMSQMGMLRVPQNPHQRIHNPTPTPRNAIDAANEKYAADKKRPRLLHPTKGFRPLNAKRDLAALIAGQMQNGQRGWSTKRIRQALSEVLP